MNKPHRIVVDLDPEKDNRPAIARARALAENGGGTIDLFVCEYLQWLAGDLIFTAETVDGTREEYLAQLAAWAEELGKSLQADGLAVTVQTAWHSPRYEALLEYAASVDAGWVIRIASNRSKLERWLLSATDWELIRQAKQRLWLVKAEQAHLDELRVLVAVDPTHREDPELARDRHLLETSLNLCEELGAELHVFHAWAVPMAPTAFAASPTSADAAAVPVPRIAEDTLAAAREKHRQRLESLLADFDIPKRRVHLSEGSPAEAIQGVIDTENIDIVVAGAVSRSWLQRLLIGSTAETLFDAIECDLIVVKDEVIADRV
jgi:universal stress protein E